MTFSKRKKHKSLIVLTTLMLIIIFFISGAFAFKNTEIAEAVALSSSNADILTTDLLLNNYSSRTDGMVFNGDILATIFKKITGNSNATYSTVLSSAKNTTGKGTQYTMPNGRDATQIRNGNNNKHVVLTIKGLKWTATALTTDSSGNPILTLMLTDTAQSEVGQWSTWRVDNHSDRVTGSYPYQMYSTSYLRAQLLNGKDSSGNAVKYSTNANTLVTFSRPSSLFSKSLGSYKFDIFAHSNVTGSITKYLVQPKNVPYQYNENFYTYSQAVWGPAYGFNESSLNKIGIPTNGDMENKTNYFDWASDYIWIPSLSEIGWGITDVEFNGLWNGTTASAYELFNTSANYWYRTGSNSNTDNREVSHGFANVKSTTNITRNPGDWTIATDQTNYIRPCIHLNLKAVSDASVTSITNPADVTTTYDGTQQDYFKSNGSNVSWYNATTYNSSNANVKVEYFTSSGNALTTSAKPIESGTYKVKLTIQSAKYKWSSGDEKIKEITYTINPKSLTVNFNTSVSPPTATPTSLCSRDTSLSDSILRIKYNTVGMTDYTYNYPTKVGNYNATVEIDTSISENYILDKAYSSQINITATGVSLPRFSTSDWLTYDGNEQFYLLEYDKDKMDVDIADEYKGKGKFDFDGEYVYVTNAGEYKDALKVTLKDPYNPADGSGFNVWQGTTADTSTKYLSFTLNECALTLSSTQSALNAQMGDSPVLSIMTTQKPKKQDVLNVQIMGQVGTSTPRKLADFTFNASSPNAQNVTLNLSDLRVAGSYKLSLVSDNTNYILDFAPPITLDLTQKTEKPMLIWWLQENGIMTANSINAEIGIDQNVEYDISQLVYDGKEYSFIVTANNGYTVDTSYSVGDFVAGYKNSKYTNAGDYITQVAIKKEGESTSEIYSIKWSIAKATFDMTAVKWKGDGKVEYTGSEIEMVLENLPDGLSATYVNNKDTSVGVKGEASVSVFTLTGDAIGNYEEPDVSQWKINWEIVKAKIAIGGRSDWELASHTNDGNKFDYYKLKDTKANGVVEYEYYETDSSGNILDGAVAIDSLDDIEYSATTRKYYKALPKILDETNYAFTDGVSGDSLYSPFFTVGGGATQVSVALSTDKIEYNGKPRNVKLTITGSGATVNDFTITYYSGELIDDEHKLSGAPTDKGRYTAVITSNKSSVLLNGADEQGRVALGFEIISATLQKNWNKNAKPYVLNLKYGQIDGIEYEMQDSNGNTVTYDQLTAGTYKIKAKIKGSMQGNYSFADGTYETDWEVFEIRAEDLPSMQDPNDPSNSNYPQEDDTNSDDGQTPSGDGTGSGNVDSGNVGGSGTLDEILEKLKELPLWQLVAGVISIILILIFMGKGASYMSKSKQNKKMAESKYKTYYAGAWLGLAFSGWTAIACVLMGLAVMSLVFMIIAKSKYNKSLIYTETLREEYERNKADIEDRRRQEEYMRRDEEMRRQNEDMQMMFMRMMGGGAGANGGGAQGMPQGGFAFVQQPGIGAEEIRGIVSETVTALLPGMQQALPQQAGISEETVQKMLNKNDEKIQKMIEKNDERIEKLLNKIMELSNNQQQAQPQITEKEVVKEVPVEKIVEVPVEVEKVVEKEVIKEVPIEKIVEKEVVKEVKVEVPVAMPIPSKPKKETAPRLTLDEAYALLSKQQQKYFDGLREYALTKDKCKEKKSTYFIVIGQSTVNPLIKLTIKKNMTVALFKMEDEYLKDIKRDATSDGTKVKVKETEVIISDAQSCKVAKNMIDLREDQIERYQELLREQRSMKKK